MTARALVLSLDAADPGLVRRLAAAGEMPAMAALLDRAAIVDTIAPPAVYVSANWPTLFTATQPDRHGYLCWDEIAPGTYERRETDLSYIREPPIWRALSEAGRRVAVFDVPHTTVEPLNGVIVAEWACHDRHARTGSWPPELAGELSARHGAPLGTADPPAFPQFAPCDYAHRAGEHRTPEETETMMAALRDSVESKRRASLELLERGGWDLFMAVMGESHCVGHQFWHLHDGGAADPVIDIYRRLDAVVGDHLAALGPDDTAYVTLAHGMTVHNDGTHLLDHVLDRLDWSLDHPHGHGRATRAARALPRAVLRRAAGRMRDRFSSAPPSPLPPRETRRWFQIPNNTVVGGVRLNLAGREPLGRIRPGDRREVLAWIAKRLEELVNLETGTRVVRECVITEDIYAREEGDAFADLYIEWERAAPIERVWSPTVGTVSVPYEHWRQGDHERGGITLATGPGIAPGRRAGTFPIVDLGATYAAAAGVRLEGVDGTPVESILPAAARRDDPAGPRRAQPAPAPRTPRRRPPAWARADAGVAAAAALRPELAAATARLGAAEARAAAAEARTEAVHRELSGRVDDLARLAEIATMMAWLPHAEVPETALVSVVMPTRDRRDLLEAAVASVLAQSYRRFELLVVDDGSRDGTAEYLAGVGDPRLRVLRAGGVGACGARNVALEEARGDVITYLDDDNRFDPHWLRAVVATLGGRPDARCCYGARIVDDGGRLFDAPPSGRPWIHFWPWDPVAVRDGNRVDMNVIAHRHGDVRFDESLIYFGDWDLLLQLVADGDPVEVPAIGAYYRTDVPGRLTNTVSAERRDEEAARIRDKAAAPASAAGRGV